MVVAPKIMADWKGKRMHEETPVFASTANFKGGCPENGMGERPPGHKGGGIKNCNVRETSRGRPLTHRIFGHADEDQKKLSLIAHRGTSKVTKGRRKKKKTRLP